MRRQGLASFIITLTLAMIGLPIIKNLPFFSGAMGFLGTYLIVLSIENEVQRLFDEKDCTRSKELRALIDLWPLPRVSSLEPNRPSLWQLIRPSVVSDLLLRNTATQSITYA